MTSEPTTVGMPVDPVERESRARAFFDRDPPDGYIGEWTDRLARAEPPLDPNLASVLIFRLGPEWLAIDTRRLVEVTAPRPIHSIPHRSTRSLLGLVNSRGQVRLAVSLHEVLGVEPGPPEPEPTDDSEGADGQAVTRMILIHDGAEHWAFLAEEVAKVQRVARGKLRKVPSTFPAEISQVQAIFDWSGRTIGYLDDRRIVQALRSLCS